MERYLEKYILKDLKQKMVLLSGPRQVGKTTISKQLLSEYVYLNFDSASDRRTIMGEEWSRDTKLVIFDEIHKMKNWKSWIKGIYDTEGITPAILVTGSARLETYRKGGDSLAGRYFSFRLHPLDVKECTKYLKIEPREALDRLLTSGGFLEPFLKNNPTYSKRWRRTHIDTIIREDLLDLERVRDIKSIEILIDLLRSRVGTIVSYSSLANDLQVSIHTIKHWLQILENLYVIFPVRPFHKNISRSILKGAKYYFYDSGAVEAGIGEKLENTVACALIKELHFIEDSTGSKVALHYLRDKEKREVDFLVVIDKDPKLMIEVKHKDDTFAPALFHFKKYLTSTQATQVVQILRQKKSRDTIRMISAAEFLANIDFENFGC